MTDIVERLNEQADIFDGLGAPHRSPILRDAAAEITRLREALMAIQQANHALMSAPLPRGSWQGEAAQICSLILFAALQQAIEAPPAQATP